MRVNIPTSLRTDERGEQRLVVGRSRVAILPPTKKQLAPESGLRGIKAKAFDSCNVELIMQKVAAGHCAIGQPSGFQGVDQDMRQGPPMCRLAVGSLAENMHLSD